MPLSLGNVTLSAFEVPSVIAFGGSQSLAVHRLPGGVRIVDSLGPDDADITWKGVLSGGGATDRSRALDYLRVSGQPVALSWDEFCYYVVIHELKFSFCNSWWIPYQIGCLVVDDPNIVGLPETVSIIDAVSADLSIAATLTDVSQASTVIASAAGAGVGTAPHAVAYSGLSGVASAIENSINSSESALMSNDIPTIVSAAGNLAMAAAARGYVARAIANYSQAAF